MNDQCLRLSALIVLSLARDDVFFVHDKLSSAPPPINVQVEAHHDKHSLFIPNQHAF